MRWSLAGRRGIANALAHAYLGLGFGDIAGNSSPYSHNVRVAFLPPGNGPTGVTIGMSQQWIGPPSFSSVRDGSPHNCHENNCIERGHNNQSRERAGRAQASFIASRRRQEETQFHPRLPLSAEVKPESLAVLTRHRSFQAFPGWPSWTQVPNWSR